MMLFVDQLIGSIKNANNKMKGDWIACWDLNIKKVKQIQDQTQTSRHYRSSFERLMIYDLLTQYAMMICWFAKIYNRFSSRLANLFHKSLITKASSHNIDYV